MLRNADPRYALHTVGRGAPVWCGSGAFPTFFCHVILVCSFLHTGRPIFSPLLRDLGVPPTGQAGGRSRPGVGERELEGLGCGVVVEREGVGENDGGGDGGEVMVVERLCGGAAGAVDGGVVDALVCTLEPSPEPSPPYALIADASR